jgi:MoaA/NifB/PqqE/SkfB family radical SAM enzyme
MKARDYITKHLRTVPPYVTPRKLAKASLNLHERYRKTVVLRSVHPFIKVEPTNLCQMRCEGCRQSQGAHRNRSAGRRQMRPDQFREVLAPFSSRLLGVSLSLGGEPLMHRDLPSLIEEAHRQRVAVTFPTNLSLDLDNEAIERLVCSGVDTMYVSLDGASPDTYARYRIGGDFALILANVKALAAARARHGRRRPRLVWKFVVFPHNQHEVDQVRRSYRELGFDAYELVPDRNNPALEAGRRRYRANLARSGRGCYWLWHNMIIQWDGGVRPCCTTRDGVVLGNAIEDGAAAVWRGEAYRAMHAGFSDPDAMVDVCRRCLGMEPAAEPATAAAV